MGPCSLFATGRGSERLYESFHALPRRPLLLLVALLLSSGLAGGAGHVHDKVSCIVGSTDRSGKFSSVI